MTWWLYHMHWSEKLTWGTSTLCQVNRQELYIWHFRIMIRAAAHLTNFSQISGKLTNTLLKCGFLLKTLPANLRNGRLKDGPLCVRIFWTPRNHVKTLLLSDCSPSLALDTSDLKWYHNVYISQLCLESRLSCLESRPSRLESRPGCLESRPGHLESRPSCV